MLLKVRRCTFWRAEEEPPCFCYHFHLWWPAVFLALFSSSSKALTSIGRSMYLTIDVSKSAKTSRHLLFRLL